MREQYDLAVNSIPMDPTDGAVALVVESLDLQLAGRSEAPRVRVLRRAHAAPLAALVEQGPSFRDDRAAIERLKTEHPWLAIIYISRSAGARREAAIRRLGIHYFLAHPIDPEELRLVLDVLIRSFDSTDSLERFFTR